MTASKQAMRKAFDWRLVATIVVVLGLGWMLYGQIDALRERTEASAEDRADLRAQITEGERINLTQQTLIDELMRRCEDAKGCTPPPVPEAIRGQQGDPGLQGPVGPPGPRGASCVEELGYPRCRGAEGATGVAGQTGVDGPAGQQGPKGEQGEAGPQGEQGPQGPAGPPGADGRGIASTTCGDDGRWVVTYTDGTTEDAGVCRVSLPNGEPKP